MQEEVIIDKFFVVDLYVPSKKLIIEVQGPQHYGIDGNVTRKTLVKTEVLKKLGYNVKVVDPMVVLKMLNVGGFHAKTRALREFKKFVGFLGSNQKVIH